MVKRKQISTKLFENYIILCAQLLKTKSFLMLRFYTKAEFSKIEGCIQIRTN